MWWALGLGLFVLIEVLIVLGICRAARDADDRAEEIEQMIADLDRALQKDKADHSH